MFDRVADSKVDLVTARSLLAFFDAAYLLALTAWVGSILFFSFGVAPIIFRVLGAESGARFVRALFPRYYAWGATSGAIALPAFLGVPLSFPEYRGPMIAVQALLILAGILIMLYAGNTLTPAINAARDAGPAEHDPLRASSPPLGLAQWPGTVDRPGARDRPGHAPRPAERGDPRDDPGRADAVRRRDQRGARRHRGAARGAARQPDSGQPGAGAERFPIDEATIRELVKIYAQRRRPPANAPKPR